MKPKRILYYVVCAAFAISGFLFKGNKAKAMKKETTNNIILRMGGDAQDNWSPSHSSHYSHYSHSSHYSHYSGR
jgi:hypothetical protein